MRTRVLATIVALALQWSAASLAVEPVCPHVGSSNLLYVPFFVVDLRQGVDGETTLFSVSNASSTSLIARVDLYGAKGKWAGVYHADISAGGVHTINLRDLFDPQSERLVCPGHPPALPAAHLRESLVDSDGVAKGYAVVHAVTNCTTLAPDDPAFPALLISAPALFGDRFFVEPGENFAEGAGLPSELTPGRHRVRFLRRLGPFDGTSLEVFAPSLGSQSVALPISAATEGGEPVPLAVDFVGGLRASATNRWDVDSYLAPAEPFGSLTIDCGATPCSVYAVYKANGRFSASAPGVSLDCN